MYENFIYISKKRRTYVLFGFILLIFLFIQSCASHQYAAPISRTGFAFDTVVTITIYDSQKKETLDECLMLCEKYESLFSATQEGSEIWNINHANGQAVSVSYDTAVLIQAALYYCAQSHGMLDLTLHPISEEWNISGQMEQASILPDYKYYIPSQQTLSQLLEHVAYQNVQLIDASGTEIGNNTTLSDNTDYYVLLKDSQSTIDLGFIAKGYIADRLKSYLLSEGVKNAIISLGGNVLLIGSKPDNTPFHVGIQKPFGAVNEIITTLQKSDSSIVSSGCYERYFIIDDDKKDKTIYHHIFDPTTGYPVQNDLLGVTILSHSSMEGDALSTYCYILGLEKGLEYIRSLENVEAIFITKNYEIISSYLD